MKRGKPADVLEGGEVLRQRHSTWTIESGEYLGEDSNADELESPVAGGEIDHARARRLIREQTQRLLPAADANALADHLLACDSCYKFAQDEAARERKRNSGDLKL
ncbi:MAG TPA: hypothetical protein VF120_05180 [Ktedonobacterales bacterium]